MNGVYNPSSGSSGGGGSSTDNTSPLYKMAQLTAADNLEIPASGAVGVAVTFPVVDGYKAVAIPQYAIWDGSSGGYGYGYAFLGNQYLDPTTGTVRALVHNRSTTNAIKVQVIVFVLYIRDGNVSTPATKMVPLNYGLGSARVTTCGKLCMATISGQVNQAVPQWTIITSSALPKPATPVMVANPTVSGCYLNLTKDGIIQAGSAIPSGGWVICTLTYITA